MPHSSFPTIEHVRAAMRGPLPGPHVQIRMAPHPRTLVPPADSHPRQAGVLLVLYPIGDALHIVLTVRNAYLNYCDAILRRIAWMQAPVEEPVVLRSGDIVLDVELHQVTVRGESCHVTPIEFELLRYFMSHLDHAIGKDELFREVWGYEFEGSTNLVEVGVRRLREKIEDDPSDPRYIRTLRGVGYRFRYIEPAA